VARVFVQAAACSLLSGFKNLNGLGFIKNFDGNGGFSVKMVKKMKKHALEQDTRPILR
jgi:hypothetical protein